MVVILNSKATTAFQTTGWCEGIYLIDRIENVKYAKGILLSSCIQYKKVSLFDQSPRRLSFVIVAPNEENTPRYTHIRTPPPSPIYWVRPFMTLDMPLDYKRSVE